MFTFRFELLTKLELEEMLTTINEAFSCYGSVHCKCSPCRKCPYIHGCDMLHHFMSAIVNELADREGR